MEVEETGTTFQENAMLKATEYYSHSNIPTLADDSGLIVNTLNGAPGIKSARYAGNNATDQENRDKLLSKLADTPTNMRKAMFVCVIAIITKPNEIKVFQGTIQGSIANKETGEIQQEVQLADASIAEVITAAPLVVKNSAIIIRMKR